LTEIHIDTFAINAEIFKLDPACISISLSSIVSIVKGSEGNSGLKCVNKWEIFKKYISYIMYFFMVKTIRISNDELHTELLKIQGQIQAKSGEFTSMDDVISELIKNYKRRK